MRREQFSAISNDKARSRDGIQELASAGDKGPSANALDRWLTRRLLQFIGNPPVAFRLWDGVEIIPAGRKPTAVLAINNRLALYKLCIDPEFNFGELYSTRDIDVEGNLARFLEIIYDTIHYQPQSLFNRVVENLQNYRAQNLSLQQTRKNIQHHYDIGNDFYREWLDTAAMQYTCAYFPDPSMTLEEAQIAKMHHVCRKLQLQPGQTVVEAGCGWGGLGLFMAMEYGVNVKAYNISHEQVMYARERARENGMEDKVEYIEDDYRNIEGSYDRFVSVGMLEHIGINNYHNLGEIIDRVLKEDGIGLIHTIGRNQPCRLNRWIEARIFPGACPPSLGQMMEIFEPQMLSILDIENLRMHYARTLQHWLDRFDNNVNHYRDRFDDAFIRAWRLYLAGSIAAFRGGTMQLFQVVFTRPRNNNLSWSRAHLYQQQAQE